MLSVHSTTLVLPPTEDSILKQSADELINKESHYEFICHYNHGDQNKRNEIEDTIMRIANEPYDYIKSTFIIDILNEFFAKLHMSTDKKQELLKRMEQQKQNYPQDVNSKSTDYINNSIDTDVLSDNQKSLSAQIGEETKNNSATDASGSNIIKIESNLYLPLNAENNKIKDVSSNDKTVIENNVKNKENSKNESLNSNILSSISASLARFISPH